MASDKSIRCRSDPNVSAHMYPETIEDDCNPRAKCSIREPCTPKSTTHHWIESTLCNTNKRRLIKDVNQVPAFLPRDDTSQMSCHLDLLINTIQHECEPSSRDELFLVGPGSLNRTRVPPSLDESDSDGPPTTAEDSSTTPFNATNNFHAGLELLPFRPISDTRSVSSINHDNDHNHEVDLADGDDFELIDPRSELGPRRKLPFTSRSLCIPSL
uniref:Uncharacterized protein n=1 Tax=Helicotheca tamesis TaxID=374047 RepID=A0A7S2HLR2_9STRA|mmetsp:Transcript_19248/g.26471  ORF Transcript_19248/g.26471 Transcript_19248/m.26471 type:complete len:214 (+) Transcript_19248:92-733(+)